MYTRANFPDFIDQLHLFYNKCMAFYPIRRMIRRHQPIKFVNFSTQIWQNTAIEIAIQTLQTFPNDARWYYNSNDRIARAKIKLYFQAKTIKTFKVWINVRELARAMIKSILDEQKTEGERERERKRERKRE